MAQGMKVEILVDVHGYRHRCDDGSYCKEAS